jgi:hypothetical protein
MIPPDYNAALLAAAALDGTATGLFAVVLLAASFRAITLTRLEERIRYPLSLALWIASLGMFLWATRQLASVYFTPDLVILRESSFFFKALN